MRRRSRPVRVLQVRTCCVFIADSHCAEKKPKRRRAESSATGGPSVRRSPEQRSPKQKKAKKSKVVVSDEEAQEPSTQGTSVPMGMPV